MEALSNEDREAITAAVAVYLCVCASYETREKQRAVSEKARKLIKKLNLYPRLYELEEEDIAHIRHLIEEDDADMTTE